MNSETATTPFPTSETASASLGGNGSAETVHRLAQRVHEAVDSIEQKLGEGSDKVMTSYQEYGDLAREQVRANPLAAVAVAFAAGYVIAKVFSR